MRKGSPPKPRWSAGGLSPRTFTGSFQRPDPRQRNGPGGVVAAQGGGEGRQAGVRGTYTPAENRNGLLILQRRIVW